MVPTVPRDDARAKAVSRVATNGARRCADTRMDRGVCPDLGVMAHGW